MPALTSSTYMNAFTKPSELLANIHARLLDLTTLLEEVSDHWGYEDPIYRYYHQSFKVYGLQQETQKIIDALRSIAPAGTTFTEMFEEIIKEGASGKKFEAEHNKEWSKHTRPFVEAFFHARYFLEMAVKHGKAMQSVTNPVPSGWAAMLELYDIR